MGVCIICSVSYPGRPFLAIERAAVRPFQPSWEFVVPTGSARTRISRRVQLWVLSLSLSHSLGHKFISLSNRLCTVLSFYLTFPFFFLLLIFPRIQEDWDGAAPLKHPPCIYTPKGVTWFAASQIARVHRLGWYISDEDEQTYRVGEAGLIRDRSFGWSSYHKTFVIFVKWLGPIDGLIAHHFRCTTDYKIAKITRLVYTIFHEWLNLSGPMEPFFLTVLAEFDNKER